MKERIRNIIRIRKIIEDLGLNTFKDVENLSPNDIASMTRTIYGLSKILIFLNEGLKIDKVHKSTMEKIIGKVEYHIESGIRENADAIRECVDCLNYICSSINLMGL